MAETVVADEDHLIGLARAYEGAKAQTDMTVTETRHRREIAIARDIAATPAATVSGMNIKARILRDFIGGEDGIVGVGQALVVSLLGDIERLAGSA